MLTLTPYGIPVGQLAVPQLKVLLAEIEQLV
jgi:hypothetical protein